MLLLGDIFETIGAGPVKTTEGVADFGIGFTDAAPDADFAAVGFMDDVRVYDGVLTLEQLEAVRMENLTVMEVPACNPDTLGDVDGKRRRGLHRFSRDRQQLRPRQSTHTRMATSTAMAMSTSRIS